MSNFLDFLKKIKKPKSGEVLDINYYERYLAMRGGLKGNLLLHRKRKIKINRFSEVPAIGQYIDLSANKARRVIDLIRGRSYGEALMMLELMPYRACYSVLKMVYSVAANPNHNRSFNKENLIISQVQVNKGKTLKRFKPRAR